MITDDINNINWRIGPEQDSIPGLIFLTKELGEALNRMRKELNDFGQRAYYERLESIEEDYRLMKAFVKQGGDDPKREELYNSLLKRLYHLQCDSIIMRRKQNTSGLNYYSPFAVARMPLEDIRQRLESFVQDAALLSLDPTATDGDKKKAIYAEHHELTTALFYHLMTDTHWNEETKTFYQELLLSPTIDANDAQLLTSALLLALLLAFDARKFATLLYLYQYATDPQVKQRALVGWALTLPKIEITLYPDLAEQLRKTIGSKAVQRELLELQYQIVYCIDAERATQEINRDIMPTMMRGQNIMMGNPTDEDRLQDIINPGAEEQAMEELEKSYMRMMDMQKKGVDVYFGGFSQMKRFPFFNKASNWFVPFYPEHPELTPLEGLDEKRIEQNLFEHSSFCNSDKYSLSLAMTMILKQIPDEIKQAINANGIEIQGYMEMDKQNPAYIRRMYLQDLYRFFFLSPLNKVFVNPFQDGGIIMRGLFFDNQLLSQVGLSSQFVPFGKFLLRKGLWQLLDIFTDTQGGYLAFEDNDEWTYLRAMADNHTNRYERAKKHLAKLLQRMPDDEKIAQEYVKACMRSGDFTSAEATLERFQSQGRLSIDDEMLLGQGKIAHGKLKEGTDILFKLNYEHPDNMDVRRALAKAQLQQNKPEAAIDLLNHIINNTDVAEPNDLLHAATAYWLVKDMPKAISLLVRAIQMMDIAPNDVRVKLGEILLKTTQRLNMKNHSAADLGILVDIVADEMEANSSQHLDNL